MPITTFARRIAPVALVSLALAGCGGHVWYPPMPASTDASSDWNSDDDYYPPMPAHTPAPLTGVYCGSEDTGYDCRATSSDDPDGCVSAVYNAQPTDSDPNAGIPQDCIDAGY